MGKWSACWVSAAWWCARCGGVAVGWGGGGATAVGRSGSVQRVDGGVVWRSVCEATAAAARRGRRFRFRSRKCVAVCLTLHLRVVCVRVCILATFSVNCAFTVSVRLSLFRLQKKKVISKCSPAVLANALHDSAAPSSRRALWGGS